MQNKFAISTYYATLNDRGFSMYYERQYCMLHAICLFCSNWCILHFECSGVNASPSTLQEDLQRELLAKKLAWEQLQGHGTSTASHCLYGGQEGELQICYCSRPMLLISGYGFFVTRITFLGEEETSCGFLKKHWILVSMSLERRRELSPFSTLFSRDSIPINAIGNHDLSPKSVLTFSWKALCLCSPLDLQMRDQLKTAPNQFSSSS